MRFQNIIWIAFVIVSCQQEDSGKLRQELIDTDRKFCKRAQEKGIAEAFVYYADEHVIKSVNNQQPIIGKYALMQSFKENPPTYTLIWEPLRAEVSDNLGYTFGGYTLTGKTSLGRDTTIYGNYISVWKRKKDGSWRYVIDAGNPTPEPVQF